MWSHKYNLLGLITYMRYTGDRSPMQACRQMADLLCTTFGENPGQRNILTAGHHVGMAPTSVLEPMVLLYRLTGEERYLEFCYYLVRSWERRGGPQILTRLGRGDGVDRVGNGKAYEMLSCLCGALELYRTTGDRRLLDAAERAWDDIEENHLYVTGGASYCELFHGGGDLPNVNNACETCVTVTWLQFNAQLLRLTGNARYAHQLEHVVMNQLLGAQRPDGAAWGYYVQMEGRKPYSDSLDGHCCLSSGPRGIALIPTFAVTTDSEGIVVNMFDAGEAGLTLRSGEFVGVKIESIYPSTGEVRLTINTQAQATFAVKLRVPEWAKVTMLAPQGFVLGADGYYSQLRQWKPGDIIALRFELVPRIVLGKHDNAGRAALLYGPLVLAADESVTCGAHASHRLDSIAFVDGDLAHIAPEPRPAPDDAKSWPGSQRYLINASTREGGPRFQTSLVPFAEAGATGGRYQVWLPLAGTEEANLLLGGTEGHSRVGDHPGKINDGDLQSIVNTADGTRAETDWYSVELPRVASAKRISFWHGRNASDGGWFDTSGGKPIVQIRRSVGSNWETIGEFADYPSTSATKADDTKLTWGNHRFLLQLPEPISFVAIRVVGVPSTGDNPQQTHSSCAEIQAFLE